MRKFYAIDKKGNAEDMVSSLKIGRDRNRKRRWRKTIKDFSKLIIKSNN